eukprot:7947898-Prorocentrum_lima.AAC.1
MTSSLVGSEMCIRDRFLVATSWHDTMGPARLQALVNSSKTAPLMRSCACLLYTSDAADDM